MGRQPRDVDVLARFAPSACGDVRGSKSLRHGGLARLESGSLTGPQGTSGHSADCGQTSQLLESTGVTPIDTRIVCGTLETPRDCNPGGFGGAIVP